MPFNPSVTDRRGEMATQAGTNIADMILSGKTGFARGIAQGASDATNNVTDGVKGMAIERERRDRSAGELQSLVDLGVVAPDKAAKLLQGSTGKLEGGVNVAKAEFSLINDYKKEERGEARNMRYLDAQTKASANLATYKDTLRDAGAPSEAETKKMMEAGYIWDEAGGKWAQDRSKFRSSNPLDVLLNGGADPNGVVPTGPTAPVAAAAPAAAPAAQPAAVGGYIPGRRYGGRVFKGGNPNDPTSWE